MAVKSGQDIESARDCSGSKPKGAGAGHGGGVGDGAGRLRVAVDAVGPALQHGEMRAGIFGEIESAGEGELLIAAAPACG